MQMNDRNRSDQIRIMIEYKTHIILNQMEKRSESQ